VTRKPISSRPAHRFALCQVTMGTKGKPFHVEP